MTDVPLPAGRHTPTPTRPLEDALGELERRRRDRWVVVAVLVVAVVGALALLVIDDAAGELSLFAAAAFLIVGIGYGATVVAQERRSRRAVRAIVAERERAAAAAARIGALEDLQLAAREVVAADDLDEVFDRLLDAARALTSAASGVVLLRVGDELTVAAATGGGAPDRGEAFDADAGAAGTAVRTGEALLVGRGAPWGAAAGASSIAAPMRLPDRTVGVLVVTRDGDRPAFAAADLAIVALFADHAALAVRNASRLDGERRNAATARAELAFLTDELQATVSVVSGYAGLLRERGDSFGPERRRALLDDVLAELATMRARLDRPATGRGT